MREIRFRLWDKENKKMIVRDSLYTYFIGILGDIGRHDVCGNATYNNGYKFYSEQFELMQYTGLKDKNGKEIYEGDVIRWVDWRGKTHQSVVKYDFEWNRFCVWINGAESVGVCKHLSKDIEIISNIHEQEVTP